MTREKIFDDVEDAGALLASYRDVTEWILHPFAGMALLTPRAFLGDGDGVTGCGGIKKSPTPCPAKL
jgi:hypothetical protein